MLTFRLLSCALLYCLISIPAHSSGEFDGEILLFEEEQTVLLGDIAFQQPINITLSLKNNQNLAIQNLEVSASCGCTNVQLDANSIAAESAIGLSVDIDPMGKKGLIDKKLTFSFQQSGKPFVISKSISFNLQLQDDNHPPGVDPAIFFGGECGECHAKPAADRYGVELFQAVCAFCHGQQAEGLSATGFTRLDYLRSYHRDIARHFISHGNQDGTMPAFSIESGGPLTDEQIESLLDYLETIKKSWKKYL